MRASRLGAMAGLALAAALAVWWLGATRLAIEHGSDAGRSAELALSAYWLARAIGVAMLGVRAGALEGWACGVQDALGVVAPSWPVVALAWSASSVSVAHVALAEGLLLAAGMAFPALGFVLQRGLRRADGVVVAATTVGTALAAALWAASDFAPMPFAR